MSVIKSILETGEGQGWRQRRIPVTDQSQAMVTLGEIVKSLRMAAQLSQELKLWWQGEKGYQYSLGVLGKMDASIADALMHGSAVERSGTKPSEFELKGGKL